MVSSVVRSLVASTLPIVTADTTWNTTSLPTGPLTATLKIGSTTN